MLNADAIFVSVISRIFVSRWVSDGCISGCIDILFEFDTIGPSPIRAPDAIKSAKMMIEPILVLPESRIYIG